jgi:2-iminobutanoate/2-iminopropanoate deaminase
MHESHFPWSPAPTDTPIADAVSFGNLVFTAGQLGANYESGEVPTTMKEQGRLALQNVEAALKAAGSDMSKVLKITVFITEIHKLPEFNEAYKEFFHLDKNPPARSAVEVQALAHPAWLVEVEAIGYRVPKEEAPKRD